MTKLDELQTLDRAIAELTMESYLGPFLKQIRSEVAFNIRSDFMPQITIASAVNQVASIIQSANTEAEQILTRAKRDADLIRQSADSDADARRRSIDRMKITFIENMKSL